MNGEKISSSSAKTLNNAMIATEFGANRDQQVLDLKLKIIARIVAAPVQAIRCLGSCAMNMCAVACGRLDG